MVAYLYFRNDSAEFDQIRRVFRARVMIHIPQVMGGVYLHVRTCARPFHASETAGRIALKFSLWLEAHYINYVFYGGQGWGASARAYPFFCISEKAGRIALKYNV